MRTDATTNATIASRRNGKEPSCEPCRKRKMKCDHQQPTCARCRRRGIPTECFYHPAPLTRHEKQQISPSSSTSLPRRDERRSDASHVPTNAISQAFAESPYVGTDLDRNIHESRVHATQRLLAPLQHMSLIQKLVRVYIATTTAGLLPGALVLPAVSDLYDRWHQSDVFDDFSKCVAEEIVTSTTTTIDASTLILVSDFCNRHHGKHLRVEILGVIYVLAALSCLYGLVHDSENRDALVQDMLRSSDEAIRLALEMAPEVTDVLIWLQHMNLLLTIALHGYAASTSCRRLDQLASSLLALNIHRESSQASIPFYLTECRKRVFVATYHHDKMIATLCDRPPRLLRRYSDCKMPLDLTDEELLIEDPLQLATLLRNLTSEGWCAEHRYSNSSWARLRFSLAMSREEVLEYSYQPLTPDIILKLKEVSKRSNEPLDTVPTHLRYYPDCWNSGLPDTIAYMLTATYLSHRYLNFQIFQLCSRIDAESIPLLLQISEDIITTVLHVGTHRTRASFLAHDFEGLIIGFGIPSAAVLATALEYSDTSLFTTLSRSKLIRNLSVFVSMLESLQGLADTKQSLCTDSANLISRVLDGVLEPTSTLNSSATMTSASSSYMDDQHLDHDLLDLSHWVNHLDWANFGSEWTSL